MISDNVRRKVQDLIARAPSLVGDGDIPRDAHHGARCSAWITEALNVIHLLSRLLKIPIALASKAGAEVRSYSVSLQSPKRCARYCPTSTLGFWETWATKFAPRRLIIFLITARRTSLMIEKWRRG